MSYRMKRILVAVAAVPLVFVGVAQAAYTTDVLRDNPLLYWNFNEAGTADAVDAVNGLAADNLVASGTSTRAASNTGLGNTAIFDGTGGSFSAADLTGGVVPSQLWALEFWFRVDGSRAGSRGDYVISSGANDPATIYDFGFEGDNKLEMFEGPRTGGASPSIDDGDWHHVVTAFYGNDTAFGVADRQDIWLDGKLVTSVSGIGYSNGFSLGSFFVGNSDLGTNGFEGAIDELAIHDIGGRLNSAIVDQEQNFEDLLADIAAHARIDLGEAVAATYTYNAAGVLPTGAGALADSGGELTDGVVGSNMFGDGTWVGAPDPNGFNGDNLAPHPQIDFDLTAASDTLDAVEIVYLVDTLSGIDAPDRVVIEFFSDAAFTALLASVESTGFINFDPNAPGNDGTIRSLMIDFANIDAPYARLSFYNNQEWTVLGEITFLEVPTPAALPAGLALMGLAAMRRRK